MINFSLIDQYIDILAVYAPARGQGITMASQASAAAGDIAVRFYNNGDPIWEYDLQSCGDWLYQNIDGVDAVIDKMLDENQKPEIPFDDYADLLIELLDIVADEDLLRELNSYPAKGSIFNCKGPIFEEGQKYWD